MTLNADALIIGIDRYDRPDIQALPGCVNDAAAAAKWLIAIGVPPDRIIAHVSPLDPKLFPTGVILSAATDKAVRASLIKLSKGVGGDKLFLFMSGHGKYVPGAGPVFLCQDYLVDGSTRENLKIEEYIEWFQSWRYRDQFLFYDACQDATASVGQLSSVQALGPDSQPGTYALDPAVSLTACYACSPGERAWAGDGRGVLVRYSLEELEPRLWADLHPDDPEQDAIQYNWATGARVVDLDKLFTNIIAGKITQAANTGQKFQTPFCRAHGRALVDGFSPILELPPLPTTDVNVDVDPRIAIGDVQSIRLQSQVIPRACFIPSKGTPLKIPITLKFPLQDLINAGCRLTPSSTWAPVNVPVVQKLAKPVVDIILQFRQQPPDAPSKNDGTDEINIVIGPDSGSGSLGFDIGKHLGPLGGIVGLPSGMTFRRDKIGPTIGFHRNDSGSIFQASQIAIDWLKLIRRTNRDTDRHVVLSPVGQPRDVRPNVRFDFGHSSAAKVGGFLQNDECVTLESFSDEMPTRVMSLRDLEDHPVEWLERGQYRVSIDLPWGRWTSRFRVEAKAVKLMLPATIGLEPLRNRYHRRELLGPALIQPGEPGELGVSPFAIEEAGKRDFWALPATRVPVAVLKTENGIRAEPFSQTSLREWDELLTVGRLDIDNPAGLIQKFDGKIPDGTAEDFGLFALAAAYVEYDRQNWAGLRKILEVTDRHEIDFYDLGLLRLASDIADERLVGTEWQQAIINGLLARKPQLPVLRWGVMLLRDLVEQADLGLPRWIADGIDPSSVVTLVDASWLARHWFSDPRTDRGRHVQVVPAHLDETPLPPQDITQADLESMLGESRIETDWGDPSWLKMKTSVLSEPPAKEEDHEQVRTRDADPA